MSFSRQLREAEEAATRGESSLGRGLRVTRPCVCEEEEEEENREDDVAEDPNPEGLAAPDDGVLIASILCGREAEGRSRKPKRKRTRKATMSGVWKFFSKPVDKGGQIREVTCRLCGSTIRIFGSTSSNLNSHLKDVHALDVTNEIGESHGTERAKGTVDHLVRLVERREKDQKSQRTLSDMVKRAKTRPHRYEADMATVAWTVFANVPLNKLDNEWFRHMMGKLHVMPELRPRSRATLTTCEDALYAFVCHKVGLDLKEAGFCALAFDMWTSLSSLHLMAISYHFIDEEWRMRSHLLDLVDFTGTAATAHVIQWTVEKCVDNRVGEHMVICGAVTDRGSNVLKARNALVPGDSEHCVPHLLKSAADAVLAELSDMSHDIWALQQLLVQIRNSDAKRLFLRQSAAVGTEHLTVILDNSTRWEGKHSMLERALLLEDGLRGLFSSPSELAQYRNDLGAPDDFLERPYFTRLGTYLAGYKVYFALSKKSQAERAATKSRVLRWIWQTQVAFDQLLVGAYGSQQRVWTTFQNQFNLLFRPLYATANNTVLAALLDPYNAPAVLQLVSDEVQEASWKKLEVEAITLAPCMAGVELQVRGQILRLREMVSNGRNDTFPHENDGLEGGLPPRTEPHDDVLRFFANHEGLAHIPLLYTPIKCVLCIPASAAKPERVFSYTTRLVTRDTNRLAADTIKRRAVIYDSQKSGVLTVEMLEDVLKRVIDE